MESYYLRWSEMIFNLRTHFSEIFTFGMKRKQKPLSSSLSASKKSRQAAFIQQCREENLTPDQVIERASVFPVGTLSRILKLPRI